MGDSQQHALGDIRADADGEGLGGLSKASRQATLLLFGCISIA